MSVGSSSSKHIHINRLYRNIGGSWVLQSELEATSFDRVNWNFPSRARRPTPLGNTAGSVSYVDIEKAEYTRTVGVVRWKGSALYCWSAFPNKVEESSSSGTGGMSTLAMNRLNKTDLNLGVILGEGRETLGLLATTAIRLTQAYKSLRKGNLDAVARDLGFTFTRRTKARVKDLLDERAYSRAWLSIQFGWLPLVNDVHTAVTRSWDKLEKGTNRKGYARADKALRADGSKPLALAAGWSGTVENPNKVYAQSLGLLNPLSLAWNLLPFSFVADWFLGINQVLMNMTATSGFKGLTRWVIYENRTTQYYHEARYSTSRTVFRAVYPVAQPIPTRFDFGGWHAITSLSLMASVFKR